MNWAHSRDLVQKSLCGDTTQQFMLPKTMSAGHRFTRLLVCVGMAIALFCLPSPAHAANCRTVEGHSVCLVEIRRSAKNYWEYRAIVSVDGHERPMEVYDCRDRLRFTRDGRTIPFSKEIAGDLVCRLYKR